MLWFRPKTPRNASEMRACLRRTFGDADAARVEPWVRPAIGFRDGAIGAESKAVGATRFGGRPDLPDGVPWPEGPDGPLAFLGQVALGEVATLDLERALPPAGTLLFFYNIVDYAWGTRPDDRGKFAVLYAPADSALRRHEFPTHIGADNCLPRVRQVSPYLRWQLPAADPLARDTLRVGEPPNVAEPASDAFTEAYWDLERELNRPHIPVGKHQLLGWANGIYQQGEDCRLMCEFARLGFPAGRTAEHAQAMVGRAAWRCLLQIGADRELYRDDWADGGTIAFMIHDDDLRNRDFSRCWCVLSSS